MTVKRTREGTGMDKRILTRGGIALVLAVLAAFPTPARATGDDAGALVKQALDALPKKSFTARLKLTPQASRRAT